MEKRGRNLVPPIFAERDLDNICESEAIEDCADGVSNVEHQHSQAAVHFIRAGAAPVRRGANAPDRRERPIDQSNDGAKFYPLHRPRERIAPKLSAPAFHVSGRLKLRKNLLEELDRQFFFRSDLAYLEHWPAEF